MCGAHVTVPHATVLVCMSSSRFAMSSTTFNYFAYGSNLLKERLLMNNPSGVFQAVGKLEDYRFKFDMNRAWTRPGGWHGAPATIVPCPGSHVWGVIWSLNLEDRSNLDAQEASYVPTEVQVTSTDGTQYVCRTYVMSNGSPTPVLPSPHYKDVILRGARQNDLPEDYIAYLESFQDNGYTGRVSLYERIMKKLKNCEKNHRL